MKRACAIVVCCWAALASPALPARDLFASPDATSPADGSWERPWPLAFALSRESGVKPGDTIWFHAGIYPLTPSTFSDLEGTLHAPVQARALPGRRVTLDCRRVSEAQPGASCLTLRGSHTWYRDLEIMNSSPVRRVEQAGGAADPRGVGIHSQAGPGTKLIHLVIHDVGTAIFESQPSGLEIYGLIAYNNGWQGPDRSHGPGVYIRNRAEWPKKLIQDSIIFQNYRQGLQGYGSGPNVFSNFEVAGNILFNNGMGRDGFHRNLMFGNESAGHRNNVFRDNITYYPPGAGGESNLFGSPAGGCLGLSLINNLFLHGPRRVAADIERCDAVEARGNVFYGMTIHHLPGSRFADSGEAFRERFPDNVYLGEGNSRTPSGVSVFARRDRYAPRRALIAVVNWDGAETAALDASALGILPGDRYELRSAQNIYGEAVHGASPGAVLEIPLSGWKAAAPIGLPDAELPSTLPRFGVFLLTWESDSSNKSVQRSRGRR